MAINPDEFGASFNDFIDQMRSRKKPEEAPFFVRKLRDHFGTEPSALPIVSQPVLLHDHPNLHSAIESYVAASNRSAEVLGVVGLSGFMGNGLANLVAPQSNFGGSANQGPVEYASVDLDGDTVVACVERGLFLVKDGEERLVIFVRHDPDANGLCPRPTRLRKGMTMLDKQLAIKIALRSPAKVRARGRRSAIFSKALFEIVTSRITHQVRPAYSTGSANVERRAAPRRPGPITPASPATIWGTTSCVNIRRSDYSSVARKFKACKDVTL